MSTIRLASRRGLCSLILVALTATRAAPALAQPSSDSSPGPLAVAGGIDVANQYVFRGVRQNSTGIATWPSADLTTRVLSREGLLERLDVHVGFWNSLHSGDTGSGGPNGKPWYESRLSGTVAFHFRGGVSVAPSYTTYLSPSDMFSTVKEVGITLAVEGGQAHVVRAIKPYAHFAFEMDTAPGMGQLDGGMNAGRYLELGATPGIARRWAAVEFPVKVGLSLGNYYELGDTDNAFGFVSVGGIVSVPLGRAASIGRWDLHGGIEFQSLGETTRVFNGGDRSMVIASFGVGWKP